MTNTVLAITTLAIPLITTASSYKLAVKIAEKLELKGLDIHKPVKKHVPETGGIPLYIGITTMLIILAATGYPHALPLLILATLLFTIGFIDDLARLDPITKPLLTGAASLPLLLDPLIPYTLNLPFIGTIKLHLLYPALIVIAIMVSSNMFNMIDAVNGSMLISGIYAGIAILAGYLYYKPQIDQNTLAITTLILILAYALSKNLYPAKIFNGDSGSLLVGGILAALTIITKTETIFLVATLPLILNGFQILASIKGFVERRNIPRPTIIENGYIKPASHQDAPITLIQLIVLRKKLREEEIIASYIIIILASFIAALTIIPLL